MPRSIVKIDEEKREGLARASPLLSAKRAALDRLHARYNRREFVHPDPLEFLYGYDDSGDREIVGIVAASLAYGRVAQIMKSVAVVLERTPSPGRFLASASEETLQWTFADFRHRFTSGDDLARMLCGAKRAIEQYGSLRACFTAGLDEDDETILPALIRFVAWLKEAAGGRDNSLLPSPGNGSACKRLNLFLRWMVRRDDVDPGGWDDVPRSKLIVPLDTHMQRICRALGMTERRQADLRTALEVTAAFRTIAKDDPVRYDFALTRLGMRKDGDLNAFLRSCGVKVIRHD